MLNILLVHNYYQQAGGEDIVFNNEGCLLSDYGHRVIRFTLDNRAIQTMARSSLIQKTFWNRNSAKYVRELIHSEKIDLIHSHNTFPLISPSIYSAAAKAGVPVVQTLHNYRLVCAAGTLSRNGLPCNKCIKSKTMAAAVVHRCYHDDSFATLAVTGMLQSHRLLGTWNRHVTCYIALTEFMKRMLIEGGLPGEKISVKPNFSTSNLAPCNTLGKQALFVGRISHGKGISELVDAWTQLPGFPIRIAGNGPEESAIARSVQDKPHISLLGWQSQAQIHELMRDSYCLVVPSLWYEGFPMVIVEAFSAGIPAIVSGHGSLAEIVKDGVTGLHAKPGDATDLAAKAAWLQDHPQEARRMGAAARSEFESKYTPQANYHMLLNIYNEALNTNITDTAARTSPPSSAPLLK